MTYEAVLIARLKATPAVNDEVDGRIYALRIPEKKQLPAITFQQISATPTLTMGSPVGEVQARVQVDCYAPDYDTAANIADAVRDALHMYETGVVDAIIYNSRRATTDKDTDVFMVSQDFIVTYNAN